MKFIGVTGGVGAGKSEILSFLEREYHAKVIRSDDLAKELMMPDHKCYDRLYQTFRSDGVFLEDGSIDRAAMAQLIFRDPSKLDEMNAIVHPAVKEEVLRLRDQLSQEGRYPYFILEAALLIEEHYDEICDELWYIYTSEDNRRVRLKASRGYSDAKIDSIFEAQLSEDEFRRHCAHVIDNNGTTEESFEQIRKILGPADR